MVDQFTAITCGSLQHVLSKICSWCPWSC